MSGSWAIARKRLARLATFAAVLLHLGVAVAPHTGTHSDASVARPHLHAAGDHLEASHDEAACLACSGLHLATTPAAAARFAAGATALLKSPDTHLNSFRPAAQYSNVLSRAPPAVV